jgi:hypothetical protein
MIQQSNAVAEDNGGNVKCEFIDEPALMNWLMVSAPPATRTSLPAAATLACSNALTMPSVTKMKVVPPSLRHG